MTFRICCKATTQLFCEIKIHKFNSEIIAKLKFNLTCEAYITMQDNDTNEMNQDEQDRWDKMNEFYQLSQICKNIQILQSYEMKLSITAVCWADW